MEFALAARYLPELLRALGLSIYITLLGFVVGGVFGILLALAKSGRNRALSWASRIYIETFRNTPLLVQLYLIFFGLGQIGLNFDPFTSAFIGLTLNNAAYTAEIFRAGFESVPRGLVEAGEALALSRRQVFQYVVFKPALRNVMPALTNQFIVLFLFSSVASIISLNELTHELSTIVSRTQLTFSLFAYGAALYYLVSALIAAASRLGEKMLFRW